MSSQRARGTVQLCVLERPLVCHLFLLRVALQRPSHTLHLLRSQPSYLPIGGPQMLFAISSAHTLPRTSSTSAARVSSALRSRSLARSRAAGTAPMAPIVVHVFSSSAYVRASSRQSDRRPHSSIFEFKKRHSERRPQWKIGRTALSSLRRVIVVY